MARGGARDVAQLALDQHQREGILEQAPGQGVELARSEDLAAGWVVHAGSIAARACTAHHATARGGGKQRCRGVATGAGAGEAGLRTAARQAASTACPVEYAHVRPAPASPRR